MTTVTCFQTPLIPISSPMTANSIDIGLTRTFTLGEIVDYCKDAVEWEDARSIVAMLNILLRRTGTDEELELVDSIKNEFVRRRYGNTFLNARVSMQQPTINGPINEIHNNDKVSLGG